MIQKLLLPLYLSEAGGEFLPVFFMMCYTLATLSVTGTVFLCTETIDGVMWAGHGWVYFTMLQIISICMMASWHSTSLKIGKAFML